MTDCLITQDETQRRGPAEFAQGHGGAWRSTSPWNAGDERPRPAWARRWTATTSGPMSSWPKRWSASRARRRHRTVAGRCAEHRQRAAVQNDAIKVLYEIGARASPALVAPHADAFLALLGIEEQPQCLGRAAAPSTRSRAVRGKDVGAAQLKAHLLAAADKGSVIAKDKAMSIARQAGGGGRGRKAMPALARAAGGAAAPNQFPDVRAEMARSGACHSCAQGAVHAPSLEARAPGDRAAGQARTG